MPRLRSLRSVRARALAGVFSLALACPTLPLRAAPQRFHLGPGPAPAGFVAVQPDTPFTQERGYGFEPAAPGATTRHFTTRVAEGNYRVTVTVGDARRAAVTTLKAELRRLVAADALRTAPGETRHVSFIVNVRTPQIPGVHGLKPGVVRLKAPRETVQEAWAWDDALTLEFANASPAVRALEIEPVTVPTVFLLGDSTVCDQSREPYASWGQMLPRFFQPDVAIANHGESGETYRDSLARRRLDKIVSALAPGDWVLLQFGHNDQKQIATKSGGPFTTYPAEIRQHVAAIRARSATPILLSPMERRGFDASGRVVRSLAEYATAARDTARELGVAFVDLNALSIQLYEAWGPEKSKRAFATSADGRLDNTHHNNFGAYELAKCVVAALRQQGLPLARHIADDFGAFDPTQPDDPAAFAVPASGEFTNQRPLGDER